jgi:undecaprenyl-diphosphatase
MTIFEAMVLGIIQGITEFLPISSTGHLTVAAQFMGLISEDNPKEWTSFMAVIQLGTLASVFIYFWKDIWAILNDFISNNIISRVEFKNQTENSKLGWLIIIGSIPVIIFGLGFKDFIEGAFTKDLYVISANLIIFAIILAIAEKVGKFKKEMNQITWKDSLVIGIFQTFALIPGSSRSGSTITGGLFIGLKRDTAAKFSFLLGIPAILGSGLLEFYHQMEFMNSSNATTLAIATIVSAISGYLAIDFLLKFLKSKSTYIFIWYRIAIAIVILLLISNGLINKGYL